jgi:hypothetical protein
LAEESNLHRAEQIDYQLMLYKATIGFVSLALLFPLLSFGDGWSRFVVSHASAKNTEGWGTIIRGKIKIMKHLWCATSMKWVKSPPNSGAKHRAFPLAYRARWVAQVPREAPGPPSVPTE